MKRLLKTKILKPLYLRLRRTAPYLSELLRYRIYRVAFRAERIQKSIARSAGRTYGASACSETVELFVDCTQVSRSEVMTGIQRVVTELIFHLPGDPVIGTSQTEGLMTDPLLSARLRGNDSFPDRRRIDPKRIRKLLLPDSSWESFDVYDRIIRIVQKNGGSCFGVIYDMIPIRYPELTVDRIAVKLFRCWHNMLLRRADHIVCISKAAAEDVIAYYNESGIRRSGPLSVSWFPLGADIIKAACVEEAAVRPVLRAFFDKPVFLMVGTVEPRKDHLTVLKAFEILDGYGADVKLLIIGRDGWKNEETLSFLGQMKDAEDRVLWLRDADDTELSYAYAHADCLIAASLAEGYGLPLIEGAMHCLPIICSDIPIFREVSQGHADLFDVHDPVSLAECILRWLKSEEHPDPSKIRIHSWKESAEALSEILEGRRPPYRILGKKDE